MHSVSGTSHELVFIMILLDNSPILETMVIKPDPTKVSDGGLRILKEVSQFRRLSPTAKITYKDPDAGWHSMFLLVQVKKQLFLTDAIGFDELSSFKFWEENGSQ